MTQRKPGSYPRSRRELPDRQLIHGIHAVLAALANPRRTPLRLWVTRNAAARFAGPLAAAPLVPEIVTPQALERIVGTDAVHQGLALEAEPLPVPDIEDLAPSGTVVVLDQVTDPHNVGAIVRLCAAFGAHALISTERHGPAATGVVAKAASGGMEHVHDVKVTNLARALETLSDKGFLIAGLDSGAESQLEEIDLPPPRALVLGAEGKGLRRLTREHCHRLVRIALPGAIESLNVATAAALALYIASRRDGMS